MKRETLFIITAILLALSLITSANALLQCSVKLNSCSGGEIDVLHMYKSSQSHAEVPTESNYNYHLCCSDSEGPLQASCSGTKNTDYDVVLNLFQNTNSHVEEDGLGNYNNPVCISADPVHAIEVRCEYADTNNGESCSDFGPDYTCTATIAKTTDSHVASCLPSERLPIHVCCKTELDYTPSTFTLTEPHKEWTNETSFYVNWTATDNYGVQCSNIVWSTNPAGPWSYITVGARTTSCDPENPGGILFGPSEPVTVTSGTTYYFSGNATDIHANTGPMIEPINTTVDTESPEVYTTLFDQDGNEIDGGWVKLGVSKVTIYFNATDTISGIQNNTLYYWITKENIHTSGKKECGEASPWGGWSNCSIEFDYDSNTVIKYYIEAKDRAGNINRTPYMFTTAHPIANFEIHNIYATIGSPILVKIQVRNLQNHAENITVALESTMGDPKPIFENIGEGDYEIDEASGKRILKVFYVNPMEEREFFIRIYPNQIGTYALNITSFYTNTPTNPLDKDSADIIVGYPASFPGLTDWAITVLITLSILIASLFYPKTEIRKQDIS